MKRLCLDFCSLRFQIFPARVEQEILETVDNALMAWRSESWETEDTRSLSYVVSESCSRASG